MDFLLSLIETLCQSLEELSSEDLVEADVALTYLKDAGFKVEWLEKKLDHVKVKKEKEQFCVARLQEMEDSLLNLWKKMFRPGCPSGEGRGRVVGHKKSSVIR